jgi:hypothetical protein
MTERFLTITLQPDWQAGLRAAAQAAQKDTYQGEVLNFESPGHFFGQLTEKRWALVRTAQGKGELSVRELARLVARDVKRVHEDVVVLADLGSAGAHRVWRCALPLHIHAHRHVPQSGISHDHPTHHHPRSPARAVRPCP